MSTVLREKRGRYKKQLAVRNKTGYKGVFESGKKFQAQLCIKNAQNKCVSFNIGRYDTALEASKARTKFINKLK